MTIDFSNKKEKGECLSSWYVLTSLCPQPGIGAAAPQAEEGHVEEEQTHNRAAVCGAGVVLSLGCVCYNK